jgi:hypothetical protein
MSVKTGKCVCCDFIVYEVTLSLRGWCITCEREFRRVTEQQEARRVLQLPLLGEEPE